MANAAQLKISQLTALVAVADYGSFSAAALQLDLAQSTVSHAIATLETELGIVLLLRGRTGAAVVSRLEAEPIPPGVRVKSLPEPLERVVGVAILENAVLPRTVFVFLDVLLAAPIQLSSRAIS